MDKDKKKG